MVVGHPNLRSQLWIEAGAYEQLRSYMSAAEFRRLQPRPVILPALNSQCFGRFMAIMSQRAGRLRGLIWPSKRQDGFDEAPGHSRYSFLKCVSIPGFCKGQCSNCLYHVRSGCSWYDNHQGEQNQFQPLFRAEHHLSKTSIFVR